MHQFNIPTMDKYLVLDTETTGLAFDSEICQIAIIDQDSRVWLDTLVKPVKRIPHDATKIHGITNEMVRDAVSWDILRHSVIDILRGNDILIYNVLFDTRMMYQSDNAHGINGTYSYSDYANFHCVMNSFAEIYGDYSPFYQSYTWQPLSTAANYYGVPVISGHTAYGDCLMTLGVYKSMCDQDKKNND